ncbi:MAG TPA: bifunctional acetate--CoA ligase family protein/GNAT family N-acetyltransferase [Pirellulales bacterium]|nr:bifunctional acetate--CoA ligase family protein/GNAT family N-acetyltransferase [Pirellulales bacterium]
MPVRNLDKIFKPQRIAVVGASEQPGKVGYTVLRNLITADFPGVVYPVNAKRESVQGIQAYPNVAALPRTADLAVICTPAPTVPGVVRQCGEMGTRGAIIISAGFREVGADGRMLEERIRDEAAKFDGLRIIGPNCLGIIAPGRRLNASFAAATPPAGRIAFVSQSGALCTSVLDWALDEGIGFSYFVSIGNMLDVGVGDLVDYFGADPDTDSIVLYVESIEQARQFMSAARAFARHKPIVAYKAGRFAAAAKAAASHTGAMAGVDAVYEAAFQRAGVVRVTEVDDLFDCAELLGRRRVPKGPRLAILTNAGGPGVMATDALLERRGELAALPDALLASLNDQLPASWSHGNPVDILGDAPPERFAGSLALLLAEPSVDAVLVILTPQAMTDPTGAARAIGEVTAKAHKPVLAVWMGGRMVREGVQLLNILGVPTYATPWHAVRAFMYLVSYARNLELLHETPRDIPLGLTLDRKTARIRFERAVHEMDPPPGEPLILSEDDSKALLAAYGIPTTRPERAVSAAAAVETARRIGFPVVLKIASPDITHKTDVGGVALNLAGEAAVSAAFEQIVASARARRPEARIEGVSVQRMVAVPDAFELILGSKQDPVFGAVILVGMGGVTAELFQDRALGLPPLNDRLARRMLESLRSWPLLTGYRGRPAAQLDTLVETVVRFSYLVADFPEITELDINPLLAMPDGVLALDARVVVDRQRALQPVRAFAHLAIRPYPEEYVRSIELADGTRVLLRPIKPEDEPLWHELLAACSLESLWSRFRYVFKETTHDMASRFCFIDYDRELAIVAELEENGRRKLAGVVRLVADPDHDEAEYAVLVGDPWQGRGLGSRLTDYALEIACEWQVRRLTAETSPDNSRMLAMFKHRGFELDYKVAPDVVIATKVVGTGIRRFFLAPN